MSVNESTPSNSAPVTESTATSIAPAIATMSPVNNPAPSTSTSVNKSTTTTIAPVNESTQLTKLSHGMQQLAITIADMLKAGMVDDIKAGLKKVIKDAIKEAKAEDEVLPVVEMKPYDATKLIGSFNWPPVEEIADATEKEKENYVKLLGRANKYEHAVKVYIEYHNQKTVMEPLKDVSSDEKRLRVFQVYGKLYKHNFSNCNSLSESYFRNNGCRLELYKFLKKRFDKEKFASSAAWVPSDLGIKPAKKSNIQAKKTKKDKSGEDEVSEDLETDKERPFFDDEEDPEIGNSATTIKSPSAEKASTQKSAASKRTLPVDGEDDGDDDVEEVGPVAKKSKSAAATQTPAKSRGSSVQKKHRNIKANTAAVETEALAEEGPAEDEMEPASAATKEGEQMDVDEE